MRSSGPLLRLTAVWSCWFLLAGCGDTAKQQPDVAADLSGDGVDGAIEDVDATDGPGQLEPFPSGFLFGTSVSGFQVDMGCPLLPAEQCDDPNSDWYVFITHHEFINNEALHLNGDPPTAGPGFRELWESDLRRAALELGANGFRMSIEWSRLFPQSVIGIEGHEALRQAADQEALAWYRRVLSKTRELGMEPLITLNHYTLPLWIHDPLACHTDLSTCDPGGWADRDLIVHEIARYAAFVATEFGDLVDLWATLNEPFAVILPGYVFPSAERSNPPGVMMQLTAAKQVLYNMIEAHARMYDAVHASDSGDADGDGLAAQVGIVYALAPVKPKDPSKPEDVAAAEGVFYLWNMVFMNAIIEGELDTALDGETITVRADLKGRLDYLGINYYTLSRVEGLGMPLNEEFSPLLTFNPLTVEPTPGELFEEYARGIYEMAMVGKDFGLPVIITENGVENSADDEKGPGYLVRHLTWLQRAIRDGADVRGYFYWTLMDNYEWNRGMDFRMGLYAVDKNDPDKSRAPRKTVQTYRTIIQSHQIPANLLERYPAP